MYTAQTANVDLGGIAQTFRACFGLRHHSAPSSKRNAFRRQDLLRVPISAFAPESDSAPTNILSKKPFLSRYL
jgi:hypothetical protein